MTNDRSRPPAVRLNPPLVPAVCTGMNAPATLTVELDVEQMRRLDEEAARTDVAPTDLLKLALNDWLTKRAKFLEAKRSVFEEHDEVLRRLA